MTNNGTISAYLDCNSPWSYFAFLFLRRNRAALEAHGIEISINAIFLGGINVGSGNKPPWTLAAKAKYGQLDLPRGMKYFRSGALEAPPFFPIMSLLPMRCMLYIKESFDRERYETSFEGLWLSLWREHEDISKAEVLAKCLSKYFDEREANEIIRAGTDSTYKKMLTDQTAMLVEKGAFGAPWYLVRDRDGREENFFGSDRFHFMFQYLGVPFRDIEILPPGGDTAKL